MIPVTQQQIESLKILLAQANAQLLRARPRDVAGASTTAQRESAERRVAKLTAAIERLSA